MTHTYGWCRCPRPASYLHHTRTPAQKSRETNKVDFIEYYLIQKKSNVGCVLPLRLAAVTRQSERVKKDPPKKEYIQESKSKKRCQSAPQGAPRCGVVCGV